MMTLRRLFGASRQPKIDAAWVHANIDKVIGSEEAVNEAVAEAVKEAVGIHAGRQISWIARALLPPFLLKW